jgi:hypothetical protein
MALTREEALKRFEQRNGYKYGQPKPAANADVLASMTPEQKRIAQEAIQSRQTSGGSNPGNSYSGPDFQSLIEAYRDKKHCSYSDAFIAVLKTEQGQQAHKDFLGKKNPHIQID